MELQYINFFLHIFILHIAPLRSAKVLHQQNLKAKPYVSKKPNDHVGYKYCLPVHVNFSSTGRCLDCGICLRVWKMVVCLCATQSLL